LFDNYHDMDIEPSCAESVTVSVLKIPGSGDPPRRK